MICLACIVEVGNHYDLRLQRCSFFPKNLKYIIVMVFNLLIVKTHQDPYSQILWYSWDWPVKIT
jgi:hypothetical protein